jgi:DNA invertase Pin-like site-specific DNA recombinase
LIAERVRAGLRNARAKEKRVGRPRKVVDASRIATLREQGLSWARIADTVKLGEGTVRRAAQKLAKNPSLRASPRIGQTPSTPA